MTVRARHPRVPAPPRALPPGAFALSRTSRSERLAISYRAIVRGNAPSLPEGTAT